MKYVHYRTVGNTIGIKDGEEDYWEIGSDGYIVRSISVRASGARLKYDRIHDADGHGALPEGKITDKMLGDASIGSIVVISAEAFEAQWNRKSENENGA